MKTPRHAVRRTFPFVFVLVVGCKHPDANAVDPAARDAAASASASASPQTLVHAEPASPVVGKPDAGAPRSYLAYEGKIGAQPFRLVLERDGDALSGMIAQHDQATDVHGTASGERFTLSEDAPKGKKPATYEGKFDGLRVIGTWKDPEAKAKTGTAFTAGPLSAFAPTDTKFEENYTGTLGDKTHIRMKLTRSGKLLSGKYRYLRSTEDLIVKGSLDPASGKFALDESNAKGSVTGRFAGVFLQKGAAIGQWSSPDGAKTSNVTLREGDGYPEVETGPGGIKIAPQEDHRDIAKYCGTGAIYPAIVGLPKKDVEKTLNAALKKETTSKDEQNDCEGASNSLPYEMETNYKVLAKTAHALLVEFSSHTYWGGAHPNYGSWCVVADLDKGTVTPSTAAIFQGTARKTLNTLTDAALKKESNTQRLTEDGFYEDSIFPRDTTSIGMDGSDLEVQFGTYEVAPYARGAPSAKIPAKDAKPLVKGTILEPFFP